MKKALVFLLFLLSSVIVIMGMGGCSKKILSIPDGLMINDEEILTWNAVPNAEKYVIDVDGEQYESKTNSFDTFELFDKARVYNIKVIACGRGKYVDSEWSQGYSYEIKKVKLGCRYINDDEELEIVVSDPDECTGKIILAIESDDGKIASKIGYECFKNFKKVTSVLIPKYINTIGDSAFSGCTSLKRVSILTETVIGGFAFSECTELKQINLSDNIEQLGFACFQGCKSLKEIKLPKCLNKIKDYLFYGCENLEKLKIPANVKEISASSLAGCKRLRELSIEDNELYRSEGNCIIRDSDDKLILGCDESKIPEDVKIIGEYAFYQSNLQEIVIPSNVETIESYAFSSCKNLSKITLCEGLKTIKHGAFSACAIKELEIPASVEEINNIIINYTDFILSTNYLDELRGCKNLYKLKVKEGNKNYRSEGNCIIRNSDDELILGCNGSTIPQGVKAISDGAFRECYDLKEVIIPYGVERIGKGAFFGCVGLRHVQLASSVKEIGDDAFNIIILEKDEGYFKDLYYNPLSIIFPSALDIDFRYNYGIYGSSIYTDAKEKSDTAKTTVLGYDETSALEIPVWESVNEIIYGCEMEYENGVPYLKSLNFPNMQKGYSKFLAPYRQGYTFEGWSTSEERSVILPPKKTQLPFMDENKVISYEDAYIAFDYDIMKDIPSGAVLYAVWTKNNNI